MIRAIKRHMAKKKVQKLRDLLNSYDRRGYHRERLDLSKMVWSIFTKDFKEGDEIYWLGHDGVYGLLHGQKIVATEEDVRRKDQSGFWKLLDELDFEPYKNI